MQAAAPRGRQCRAACAAAETSLQPFHLAFPVRDLAEARNFYGGCAGSAGGLRLFDRARAPCCRLPTVVSAWLHSRKLGCPEGRSAATWVDYSLFGHQIVCHHVEGYSAVASRNAGTRAAPAEPPPACLLALPQTAPLLSCTSER